MGSGQSASVTPDARGQTQEAGAPPKANPGCWRCDWWSNLFGHCGKQINVTPTSDYRGDFEKFEFLDAAASNAARDCPYWTAPGIMSLPIPWWRRGPAYRIVRSASRWLRSRGRRALAYVGASLLALLVAWCWLSGSSRVGYNIGYADGYREGFEERVEQERLAGRESAAGRVGR
jgi:hypothetical protein